MRWSPNSKPKPTRMGKAMGFGEITYEKKNVYGWIPVIRGYGIALEPFEPRHATGIVNALDDEVTEYLSFPTPKSEPDTLGWIEKIIPDMESRRGAHFAICNKSGTPVGVTSILYLDLNAGLGEVGSWLAKAYWGSGYNLAAKRMLLGFAFDELKLKRIRITSFTQNERSTAAIHKLGLHYEGIVRRDVFVKGDFRDRHYFSILDDEWPEVRARIEMELGKIPPLPD
jgi:RimJ/RimL family protein N-acetyltransferase